MAGKNLRLAAQKAGPHLLWRSPLADEAAIEPFSD
jgi:hypothetical protein